MGEDRKVFLVTGGAGFIGSAVVRHLIAKTQHAAVVVDKLTYAANLESLASVSGDPRYAFIKADILDTKRIAQILDTVRPDVIMHLAAESHVDRSIDGPADFIQTNIVGTGSMLQAALGFWRTLGETEKKRFRFHHVSTDEVFGSLGTEGLFTEDSPYRPSSPYAASKAGADHLARAWHRTYGLPIVMSNCSNNYGPCQFPEKLIPLMILNCLEGKPLPIYGSGENVRDWLYVGDHAEALVSVAEGGAIGDSYNVGGNAERSNIAVVRLICGLMDRHVPLSSGERYSHLITHVEDRPGHDQRYAIDSTRIRTEIGWAPSETFESGLDATVRWYLENRSWWEPIRAGTYRGERLGIVS